MTRNKLLVPLLALIGLVANAKPAFAARLCILLCMGALFFAVPAYASDSPDVENLTVDSVWLEGEILNIEVTDKQTGINQTLEISLTDYAGNSEYVSVQAVDNSGNKSNTIHFKNPFYTVETNPATPSPSASAPPQSQSGVSDSSKPTDGLRPLTPDGTGTVTDNVTDGDGKEFFTITTEDGNVFYMVIDRQRSTENVYLLNSVTEDDLAVLAEKSGKDGTSQSGIPAQNPPEQTTPEPSTPEPEQTIPPTDNGGMNSGTLIFILVAAVIAGGAGYYFKILRPKKNAASETNEDEYEDMDDYGDEDYDNPDEDGDDE